MTSALCFFESKWLYNKIVVGVSLQQKTSVTVGENLSLLVLTACPCLFYLLPAVCPLLLVTSGVSAMAALDCRVLDCCIRLCVFHCFLLAVCPL